MAKHVARHRRRKTKEEESGPSLPLVYVAAESEGEQVRSQGKSEKSGVNAEVESGGDRGQIGPDQAALARARALLEGINKRFKPYGAGEHISTEEKISEKSGESDIKCLEVGEKFSTGNCGKPCGKGAFSFRKYRNFTDL